MSATSTSKSNEDRPTETSESPDIEDFDRESLPNEGIPSPGEASSRPPTPETPQKLPRRGWRRPKNGELLVPAISLIPAVLAMITASMVVGPDISVTKYFASILVGSSAVATIAAALRVAAHFNDDRRWDLAGKVMGFSAAGYALAFALLNISIIS